MGILHSRDESTKEAAPKKVRRTYDADSTVKRSAAGALEDNYAVDPKVPGTGPLQEVRKCYNRATGEKCAVKAIPRAKIHRPEVLEREISILRNLKHPNIVEIRDVFQDQHHVFIVTELCEGGELFDAIIAKTQTKEGHYSERDAAGLIKQILDALAYCHAQKPSVVHRDLKPENLFISPKLERLKVIDFGLATEEHRSVQGISDPLRTRVGTPYYIACEVLREGVHFAMRPVVRRGGFVHLVVQLPALRRRFRCGDLPRGETGSEQAQLPAVPLGRSSRKIVWTSSRSCSCTTLRRG